MRTISGDEWVAMKADELIQELESHYQSGYAAGLAAAGVEA